MSALTKQTLVNLLIDSPLREPIKINLIDIVNNTQDADLPKVYPTITKELEIFQKATDRRLKLADETIKKLASETPAPATPAPKAAPPQEPSAPTPPPAPAPKPEPKKEEKPAAEPTEEDVTLKAAAPDLPPLPKPAPMDDNPAEPAPAEAPAPAAPTPAPADEKPLPPPPELPNKPAGSSEDADEAALKEIQKELDALKADASADADPAPAETDTPETKPEATQEDKPAAEPAK